MVPEAKASLLTKDVLKSISYHLSSREDCRGIEYTVRIYHDDISGNDGIEVSPYISVFPNIYNRKESDRRGVAYHVISHHFPDILMDSASATVHIKCNSLVRGTYTYKRFKLTPRRKWKKISTSD